MCECECVRERECMGACEGVVMCTEAGQFHLHTHTENTFKSWNV